MPLRCINEGGTDSRVRLDRSPIPEQPLALPPAAVAALRRWRSRPGEIVTVQAPDDSWWRARLTGLSAKGGEAVPFARLSRPAESPLALTVAQAIPARERFELVLEKLTELGVARIVPLVTERSLTQAERDHSQAKSHRWPEVLRRAACQCRRGQLPELTSETTLAELLRHGDGRLLLLDERGEGPALGAVLRCEPAGPTCLLVGPEGGFTDGEVARAAAAGAVPVSLGGRILRTETAALTAAALVQHHWGDLAGR